MKKKSDFWIKAILWIVQGFIVGVGAILPGVSGGTLCYVFGIYDPLIEVLSKPVSGIKKYWWLLVFVGIGGALGFVGFAGVTNWLLNLNEAVVLCVFAGLIFGTLPEIWKDSGSKGRNKISIAVLVISFVAILTVFYVFKNVWVITLKPDVVGWIICGLLWGLSFIVPGFSSSTLILFFGIYEAMSAGISHLDFKVLIPLGIAMLATLLLFSRVMKHVFEKHHSIASHCVLGFVLATTIMVLPSFTVGFVKVAVYLVSIACGAVASYFFSVLCTKLRGNN